MSKGLSRRGFLGTMAASSAALATEARAGGDPAEAAPTLSGTAPGLGPVSLTVNGTDHSLEVGPDEVVLDSVRQRLGLTGAKRACGHGACGACTMLVDGVPHATCLLPTADVHGRSLATVEALGSPEALHPVQKAFLDQDALQCGFCTPGFVVEAVAFYDTWRAAHPAGSRPSEAEVADALAGHLCRCGAYPAITEAVARACAGDYEDVEVEGARVDGLEKVTGAAQYTVDIQLEGMLEAVALRSPHAHAIVKGVEVDEARGMPGVGAVLVRVEPGGRVRFAGQEVVLVAAETHEQALDAMELITVDYEVLPAVIGMDQATAEGAQLVYETKKAAGKAPSASEGPVLGSKVDGNVRGPVSLPLLKEGAARKALEAADVRHEATYLAHTQSHTSLEPHAAVARWNADGSLDVWLSTQAVYHCAHDLADRYELSHDQVRVLGRYVGGAFGGKTSVAREAIGAVDLARESGKPVRYVMERSAEIGLAALRPGAGLEVELGATQDGAFSGMSLTSWSDSGVSAGSLNAAWARLIYKSKLKELADYEVFSHTPGGQPFRAPGGPQCHLAVECAVDAVAHELGKDPIALRQAWDPNENRNRLYSAALATPLWKERPATGSQSGRLRKGVGIAAGVWPAFLQRNVYVQLDATKEGITLRCACQDMGNGSRSVLAWGAAGVLGMKPSEIAVDFGDSHLPPGPMSAGSRTAVSLGPISQDAARALQDYLLEHALDQGLSDATIGEGGVQHAGGHTTWTELLQSAPPFTTTLRRGRDPMGYFLPFGSSGLWILDTLGTSVQLIEVEVDTWTGGVRVTGSWTGMSVGRIKVPQMARNLVQGGVVQGISYSLYEDRLLDPATGRLLSAGLETYRIAGLGDIPDLEVHFDEEGFDDVAGQGIGLAELCTVAVMPAIVNAVFNATGHRPTTLPLTPEKLQGVLA